jgi:hypothetical protein
MDDVNNEIIFDTLQKDCEWKEEITPASQRLPECRAGNLACNRKNCVPLKFALFFSRPEISRR